VNCSVLSIYIGFALVCSFDILIANDNKSRKTSRSRPFVIYAIPTNEAAQLTPSIINLFYSFPANLLLIELNAYAEFSSRLSSLNRPRHL